MDKEKIEPGTRKPQRRELKVRMPASLDDEIQRFLSQTNGIYYSKNQFINEAVHAFLRSPKIKYLIERHTEAE